MEWIIGGVVVLFILNSLFKPRSCDICGLGFKKRYFKWKIEGKTQHLCPNCNSKMERRVSKNRFNQRFGK